MTDRIRINSLDSLAKAIAKITKLFNEHRYLIVSFKVGKDRTVEQNALWFALYARISQETGIGEVEDARKYCKLHFGIPILRKFNPVFRDQYNQTMLHLDYSTKLMLMGPCDLFGEDGFPVTRLFNRKEGIMYTEAIVDYFREKGVYFDDLLSEEAAQEEVQVLR